MPRPGIACCCCCCLLHDRDTFSPLPGEAAYITERPPVDEDFPGCFLTSHNCAFIVQWHDPLAMLKQESIQF